ncbi:hypothetical protein [Stenotrophomonas geniculata]
MPQSSPPVPAKLQEMLKDYPEYIERLQKALNSVKDRRIKSTPPFEAAVWLLEDHLSGFIAEARAELATAETSGNPQAIAQANEKLELMFMARSGGGGMLNISDLAAYFETHKEHY